MCLNGTGNRDVWNLPENTFFLNSQTIGIQTEMYQNTLQYGQVCLELDAPLSIPDERKHACYGGN